MTPLLFIALSCAGGLGAVARMVLDGVLKSHLVTGVPWATVTINLSGSLALGLLTGMAAEAVLPQPWLLILGTGFLGGYTTFSTASYETVRLLQQRRWGLSLASGVGTLVMATALAGLGLWLGHLM